MASRGPSGVRVASVRYRDIGLCVRCGTPDNLTTHHRKPRGMGGTKDPAINDLANLLTLCGSGTTGCHGWVEANRAEAKRLGFLVSQWADPAVVPVASWRGWVLVDGDVVTRVEEPAWT